MRNINAKGKFKIMFPISWILLSAYLFLSFNIPQDNPKRGIVFPQGASVRSLRNDDKAALFIPGCSDGLFVDDMNNLHGDNWTFYLVGKIESLDEIQVKPYCSSDRIALRAEHGYVACYSLRGSSDVYVRLMVTEMVANKDNEVIGATILYQKPYQSSYEMKQSAMAKAELEAQKIFWNGGAVPDKLLRRLIISTFDENGDDIISESESLKNRGLIIDNPEIKSILGIENLKGLSFLKIEGLSIYHGINLSFPDLKKIEILNLKEKTPIINISNCKNLDSLHIGHCYTHEIVVDECENLAWLDFDSPYYINVNSLKILGCNKLKKITHLDIRGKTCRIAVCHRLEKVWLDRLEFNDISIVNCDNLKELDSEYFDYRSEEYGLKKLNIINCDNIEMVNLSMSYNLLTYLDLSFCYNLKELHLNCPELKGFKINDLNIEKLVIENIKIKELVFKAFPRLKHFEFSNNLVKNLSISQCDSLEKILTSGNDSLCEFYVISCPNLDEISCSDNRILNKLSVKDCGKLKGIYCPKNRIENLEIVNCINLKDLSCYQNDLNNLDVSKLFNLERLVCFSNKKLTFLHIENCPKINAIGCSGTSIQELDISNLENNEWIFSLEDYNYPLNLPLATMGFKTLWVNENQKLTIQSENGSTSVFFKDKDFNKKVLLSARWDDVKKELIPFTKEDLDFKIKVKKR